MSERNPDELGALWVKTGAKGEYMTGQINGIGVVVFRNQQKTGNQPDWRVLKARSRDEGAPVRANRPPPPRPDDLDDDPFS